MNKQFQFFCLLSFDDEKMMIDRCGRYQWLMVMAIYRVLVFIYSTVADVVAIYRV